MQTDYQGVVEQTCTNLPYGDGVSCGPTPSEELYAGLDRDSESGLYHAMYRQYSSTFGRWTTPDPYGGSYNFTNPQSLNRYAYVNGSPLGATDRSGLFPCPLCVFSYNGGSSTSLSFWGGGSGLSSSLLSSILGYAAPFVFGADIYELGKAAGLWGGGPKFHGNAPASQSGKNVPNAPRSHICGDFRCSNGHFIGTAPGGGAITPEPGLILMGAGGILGLADGVAAGTAAGTGTVWDSITATQEVYDGTVIPRSFELETQGAKIWVHGNATEHMAEYALGNLGKGVSTDLVNIGTQSQLTSLQFAVGVATENGVTYGTLINEGDWELIFSPAREAGQLPALIHAYPY